ncbi:MAG TPA: hypothetical protein VGR28_05135 [Candidatus Thermoplasmatota archaeon]|nr:hypothetical protein [Candidatus Thermoplasmatota archaeon]
MAGAWMAMTLGKVAALVLAGLMIAPLGLAQEAPAPDAPAGPDAEKARPTRTVSFYGHVFGFTINAPMPANTIFPFGDANLGLGANEDELGCGTLFQQAGLAPDCQHDPTSTLALFLTAGPVQVHDRHDFNYSLLHNEHGRTKDVVLDPTQDITANLWMTLDFHSWSVGGETPCPGFVPPPDVGCPYPYWGWDPAVWPGWVVEATLYMVELGDYGQGASDPPPIAEHWASEDMTVVAHGATAPKDVQNGVPGSDNVYRYDVNLGKPQVTVIPKTMDLVLVYNWYSITNGQQIGGPFRLWSGEMFPTTFTLPTKNALDVELVIPQFVHDKLLIHSVISSAWGSYDVDVPSAKVTVLDSGLRPVDMPSVVRVGDYQVAHGAHFKPVNITWIWDYKADKLRPGTYKVLVEACNRQHSACEATEAAFTIGEDLAPTDVVVGRQGQRTISEGQLDAMTGGTEPGHTGGYRLSDLDLPVLHLASDGAILRDGDGLAAPSLPSPSDDAPQAEAVRAAPGAPLLLAMLAAAGLALAARRRP